MDIETLTNLISPLQDPCILCGKPTYLYYEFTPKDPKKFGFKNPSRHGEKQVIYIAVCERHPTNKKTRRQILRRLVAKSN